MDPIQAIKLTNDFAVSTVMLIFMSFFLAWLIIYVIKENRLREIEAQKITMAREERLAKLIEKDFKEHDERTFASLQRIEAKIENKKH